MLNALSDKTSVSAPSTSTFNKSILFKLYFSIIASKVVISTILETLLEVNYLKYLLFSQIILMI
jgi:hypothetical protein